MSFPQPVSKSHKESSEMRSQRRVRFCQSTLSLLNDLTDVLEASVSAWDEFFLGPFHSFADNGPANRQLRDIHDIQRDIKRLIDLLHRLRNLQRKCSAVRSLVSCEFQARPRGSACFQVAASG
jgi:hypothetical protein